MKRYDALEARRRAAYCALGAVAVSALARFCDSVAAGIFFLLIGLALLGRTFFLLAKYYICPCCGKRLYLYRVSPGSYCPFCGGHLSGAEEEDDDGGESA